ncbi:MAG: hypothetical protein HPY52_12290 [Firmicutes bacterium]|nr:hypothetical protein [Bacillota bacterium]
MRFLESFLIVLAIALGVAVVATFAGLIGSVSDQARAFARNPIAWGICIIPRDEDYASFSSGPSQAPATPIGPAGTPPVRLTMRDMERLRQGVTSARYVFTQEYRMMPLRPAISTGNKSGAPHSEVMAITPEFFDAYGLRLGQGTFFTKSDISAGSNVIVLGSKLAKRLFGDAPAIGQELLWGFAPVGPGGSRGGASSSYTVIGVLEPVSPDAKGKGTGLSDPMDQFDECGFIPITSTWEHRGPDTTLREIWVMPASAKEAPVALDEVRKFVEREYRGGVAVHSALDDMKHAMRSLRGLAMAILLIASAGMVIAAINILNLMLARVLRRTKAIGISIALGASRQDIFLQLLGESFILGLAGGGIGLILAMGGVRLIAMVTQGFVVTVGLWGLAAGIGASCLASLVFGAYPAYLAARSVAADALREV